ncbi:MAG: F0F1 ATP synthase subunit A [Nitrospinota bacterium]|nr:F0F1 ATP synthase subunit A [Nitrospinota bacterium]
MEHHAHVTFTWVIMIGFMFLAFALRGGYKMAPEGLQNVMEMIIQELANAADSVMGHHGRTYFPVIATLAFFILCANLIGLIPGCVSPTSNLNTTLALALIVFLLYQFVGVYTHGFGYIKQFLGPVWWLAWMMLPIEIISHLARPVSLSMRLFGNVRGDELVILVLGFLVPLVLPMPMIVMTILFSVIQTAVFVILTMVYISGALEEAH